ncbi:MAG: exopolysaccharide biosynthesis polyprenyl glycosylphosphotransferase [Caulobacterales bacterium]|uniref:exopolysaccharide biosynthesis polyprenyl glycosylphosphotransferase n=1 Tax=Glycocaulis sp. TaxID=1969725 RepID=UPI003F9EDC70
MAFHFGSDGVLDRANGPQTQLDVRPLLQHANVLRAFGLSDMLAFAIMLGLTLPLASPVGDDIQTLRHIGASLGLFGVVLLWLRSRGHYRARQGLANQVRPILMACALALLGASTVHMMSGEPGLRTATLVLWASLPALMLALRFATRAGLEAVGAWAQPVTLITPAAQRSEQLAILKRNADHGLVAATTVPLESLDGLDDAALARWLDALGDIPAFLAPDETTQGLANRLASQLSARGECFYYQPAIGRIPTQNIDLIDYPPSDGFVFRIGDSLDRPLARRAKRAFDILASAAALILIAPAMLAFAMLIRRDGGPALFVQPRVGKDGRTFGCLKFRTMCVDAEARLAEVLKTDPERAAQWETFQKLDNDPRITATGHWLRKFSLDELPQLINVLKGDMSLIGPRPMTLDQQSDYGPAFSAYVRMRPGITGLWQVNGRNATSFAERARLDDWYARNWSLWRDAVILIRTVREIVIPSGR